MSQQDSESRSESPYAKLLSVESLEELTEQPADVQLALLRHHLELARLFAKGLLTQEVIETAGERYSREKPHGGRYSRWGKNPGSVKIGDEKVPIGVPRMVDNETGETFSPEIYDELRELPAIDDRLQDSVLLGLSTGDYGRVASTLAGGFGLSQSSVSRAFIERSAEALETFENRSLEEQDILALIVDGKHVAGEQMIIALGVTLGGEKIPLGFVQASSEAHKPIVGLFRGLIARGLSVEDGLLCVVDGGKGLRKAIDVAFGKFALVQRCQWHKRENVTSYLNKQQGRTYRKKLQRAYQKPTYEEAKAALMEIHAELMGLNRSAANSLMEGFEETLTLHRLGVFEEVGRTLKTTNVIESLNSQVGKYIGKVKRWHHSEQRHRWMALALLEAEQHMRRVAGYRDLPKLRVALQTTLKITENDHEEGPPLDD